jgi:hypothetical protein
MVKPDEILGFRADPYSEEDRRSFWAKYNAILEQQEFQFTPEEETPVKPIDPPDFRFKIKFRSGSLEHEFSVFDWEVDALYCNCRKAGDSEDQACAKVIDKLRTSANLEEKDVYFFLGNIANHPHVFTIAGLWYPKKRKLVEAPLFDGIE